MRILLAAQFFPPDIGGEERHVFNLANILAARGHHVAVATQQVPGLPATEKLASAVRVHRFGTLAMRLPGVYASERQHHLPVPDPVGVRRLARILDAERPDVVHAHNWVVNSLLPLRWPGGRRDFGLVLTLHDYSSRCATKRLMRSGAPCAGPGPVRCLACAAGHYGPVVGPVTAASTTAMRPWKRQAVDYTVSVSRAVAQGNGVPDGPTAGVIPNFVPDELLRVPAETGQAWEATRARLGLPAGEYLLFVGDLSRDKGLPVLLRAYESLGPARPRLVLVGRRTPETPGRLPDGADIHFGWPHEDVMAAFRQCTAAVLPSAWPDPCPTTVLEAMASGRPVVTTAIGGMRDMVEDGESGLLVAPGDHRDLASGLSRVLADGGLRSRLGAGGRERAVRFTASAVAARLEQVYATAASPYRPVDGVAAGAAGLASLARSHQPGEMS
jgi:glycosyltransferase involved in cell wall biosynthesis